MRLLAPLRDTTRSHWTDAGTWLLYNLAGSLAPVWLGILLLELFSRSPTWADFSRHGEFALYSAAMFAPAFYVITRDLKVPGFAGRQILSLLALLGMFAAAGFFAAVTTAFLEPKPLLEINQTFLRRGTVGLFAVAVTLSFLVTVLDNARQEVDVRGLIAQQREKLAKQFEELGGGQ